MKNNNLIHDSPPNSKAIKKSILAILIAFLAVFPWTVDAQKLFDLSLQNVEVSTVLEELRRQSEINFIYNEEELKKIEKVSIQVTNATLEEVLEICFKNSTLTYKNVNNTIVITPRSTTQNENNSTEKLTQIVRGTIIDMDSKLPLIGATVVIADSDPIKGATTDIDGKFRIDNVPVGRISLKVAFLGYEEKTIANLVVTSAKEVVINASIQEAVMKIDAVVVFATKDKGEATNDMAMLSSRSISTEESNRYAGPFNDPTRIMSNYAGVASTNDGSNDIIVRGNSPKYVQWRLEGIQITNPNHFGDQNGVSQGGISALNNNLLATSDFYAGAFAPEFGDVLSGVYDVKLRAGNNEKYESIFGFGLLGTDLTFEGPLKKGYGGSFLLNYRYSTVGLISKLGLVDIDGAVPTFQDAVFKLVFPTKKFGDFSIFGLGGASSYLLENQEPADAFSSPGSDRILSAQISKDHESLTRLGNLGLNHTISLNKSSFLHTALSYSVDQLNDEIIESEILQSSGELEEDSRQLTYESDFRRSVNRAEITYSNKLNRKHKIQVGTKFNLFHFDFKQDQFQFEDDRFVSLVDLEDNISTLRNFVSWKYRIGKGVTIVSGLHNMNVLYNQKSTLEPRLALNWQIDPSNSVHAGYGKHSTMETIHNYFARVESANGNVTEPNKNLDLLKANHYVMGYQKRFNDNLMAKIELYYQGLYNLPVANNDTSFYATINEGTNYKYLDLVNEGTGKNYGIELTVERFFSNSFYFLFNTSLYESKYKSLEGVERNTRYNGKYLANLLVGKEFVELGRKKNKTLGINLKAFYGGGKRQLLMLRDEQGVLDVDPDNNRIWDYENSYENKIEDLYQITVSANYKWEKSKTTHEIWLSLDNLTDSRGKIEEFYDETSPGNVGYLTQFGFFPNLMYRVYF